MYYINFRFWKFKQYQIQNTFNKSLMMQTILYYHKTSILKSLHEISFQQYLEFIIRLSSNLIISLENIISTKQKSALFIVKFLKINMFFKMSKSINV